MTDSFDSFSEEIISLAEKAEAKSGKNSKSTIVSHGINFDSNEEADVYEWILEGEKLEFLKDVEYQPSSFELFEGLRNEKGKLVVRPHVYTADFKFVLTDKWREFQKNNKIKIFHRLVPDDGVVYIDVKGSFNRFGGDRNFGVNSKWVLAKFGIYVWKIEPKDLFSKTWLPKECIFTKKTKKQSKKYSAFKTFENHNFIL